MGRSRPSARTPGKPPPRSRTRRAISRAVSTLAPRRLTLKAMRGRRTPMRTPPAHGCSLAGHDPARARPYLVRAGARRGRPAGRRRARGRPPRGARRRRPAGRARPRPARRARGPPHARPVVPGRAARAGRRPLLRSGVCALVARQVDPLRSPRDAAEQRLHELRPRADEREHGAVVIPVRVHVEQARGTGKRLLELGKDGAISPLRKFGTDSSGSAHGAA